MKEHSTIIYKHCVNSAISITTVCVWFVFCFQFHIEREKNVPFYFADLTVNNMPNHRPDSVSMLTDYSMPSSTSPVSTIASLNENMNGLNGLNGITGMNGINGINGMGGLNLNGNGVAINGRMKATPMHIRYKFGSLGPSRVQFNSPHGFCLGVDEEIIVADTNNHRIEIFEKDGTFKMQFGVRKRLSFKNSFF